jgi:hypothetical protein
VTGQASAGYNKSFYEQIEQFNSSRKQLEDIVGPMSFTTLGD